MWNNAELIWFQIMKGNYGKGRIFKNHLKHEKIFLLKALKQVHG